MAATRPTISWPGTIGSLGFGNSPSTTCRSVRQTPQAATSMRISPDAGSAAGRSRMTSGARGLSSTMARMRYLPSRERNRLQRSYSEPHVLHVGIGIEAVAGLVPEPDQAAKIDADQ